jgi:uncharacterized protein
VELDPGEPGMNRIVATAALLLALFFAPVAHGQESWTGDWHGTLTIPTGQLRLVVTVREEAGKLAAELESPDQAPGRKIPISDFSIADGRMTFAIPAIGARYEGSWKPEAKRFSGTFTQGGSLPLDFERGAAAALPTVDGLDGRWNGSVTRNGTVLRLILHVATTPAGGTVARLDSPDLLANGLQVTGLTRVGQTVSFAVPAGGTAYRGTLDASGAKMTGSWSRPGSPDAEVTFVRATQPAAARVHPQTPRGPFPYRAEDVAFDNPGAPGVRLAGTLTLPPGPGPFPAAILISGSGPQDRDETLLGHKPFAVIADYLTRRGIAVLRYDDRGVGGSTGSRAGATSADFATDANAAFAWLATRPEIDARAIGFIGHSEGGMIGPIAMQDNARVGWLVMLGGPGTPIPELLDAQRRAIGRSQGQSDADLDRSAPLQRTMIEIAASPRSDAEARAALEAALTDSMLQAAGVPASARGGMIDTVLEPWFRQFLRYDPAPVLRRITVPVLAIGGTLDLQVVSAANLAGIRAALDANRDVTVTEFPGLNHLFQTARTGAVGEYADIEETVAPAVLESLAAWIETRFVKSR